MNIVKIYTKNGRECFPRNGMIINEGSIVQTARNEFVQLTEDHIYTRKVKWDNLCQSKEEVIILIPVTDGVVR